MQRPDLRARRASWNYVCLLVDLYNREIVGHSAGPRRDARAPSQALGLRALVQQLQDPLDTGLHVAGRVQGGGAVPPGIVQIGVANPDPPRVGAEARVLSLAKGTVSIESLFAKPTYSAKTKRVYAVPSKLSYHGRTFKVATLGCGIYPKASKAVDCRCLSSLVISLPQSPAQCAAPA